MNRKVWALGVVLIMVDWGCTKTESGMGSGGQPTVHGTWLTQAPAGGGSITLALRPDGTGSMADEPFRYSIDGNRITIRTEDESMTYDMSFDARSLSLSMAGLPQPLRFTRAGGGPADAPPVPGASGAGRKVVVNQAKLADEQVSLLERTFSVKIQDGEYWYDRMSGAWGMWGGPVAGQILPGLEMGGPLTAGASGGGTNVFVNGRELHLRDVQALMQFTPVPPGRYWVDAQGFGGIEGQPATFNLLAMARQASGGGKGNPWIHRSSITGIGAGGDGNFTYVIGKDFSVSSEH